MWNRERSSITKTTVKTKKLRNGNVLEYTIKDIDGKKEYHVSEKSNDFSGLLYDGFEKPKADRACIEATESARKASFVKGELRGCNFLRTLELFKEGYVYDDDKCAVYIYKSKKTNDYMAQIRIPKANVVMETAEATTFDGCVSWVNEQRLLFKIMEVENED